MTIYMRQWSHVQRKKKQCQLLEKYLSPNSKANYSILKYQHGLKQSHKKGGKKTHTHTNFINFFML
jgi:hypothetical protein